MSVVIFNGNKVAFTASDKVSFECEVDCGFGCGPPSWPSSATCTVAGVTNTACGTCSDLNTSYSVPLDHTNPDGCTAYYDGSFSMSCGTVRITFTVGKWPTTARKWDFNNITIALNAAGLPFDSSTYAFPPDSDFVSFADSATDCVPDIDATCFVYNPIRADYCYFGAAGVGSMRIVL